MAKIRLGGLAQDVRGSQNGLTFSRNKGGAYVRQRVSPTNVASPARTRQRNIFSANAKAWSGTLTSTQRSQWTAFAAANPVTDVFGASIILSGLAMYQRLNAVLQTIGVAVIAVPPLSLIVTPNSLASAFVVNHTGPAISITTAAQVTNANTDYYVFATAAHAVGKTPGRSAYRFIGAYPSVAAATSIDIHVAWLLKYAAVTTGAGYSVLVAQCDNTSGAVLAGQVFNTVAI